MKNILTRASSIHHMIICIFILNVWFLGHPILENTLNRTPYAALASRIQVREKLEPVFEQQRFSKMLKQAFIHARVTQQLLADSGIELIRMASKGKIRIASLIIQNSLRIATDKKINHLPDEWLWKVLK